MFNREVGPVPLETFGLEEIPGLDPSASEAVRLGRGFSSSVYRVDEQVIKIGHSFLDLARADTYRLTFFAEHSLIDDYLGDHIPPTEFHVARSATDSKLGKVVTIQQYVDGYKNIADYVAANIDSGWHKPVAPIRDMLLQGLEMFDDTRMVPDMANIQQGFSVFTNRNIIVDEDGDPHLVDTNFGHIQRSYRLGPLWHRMIRRGISQLAEGPLLNTPLAEASTA